MRFVLFFLGLLLTAFALLARALGFDHDDAWGSSRYLLLFSGLLLAGWAALLHFFQSGKVPPALYARLERLYQTTRGLLRRLLGDARIAGLFTTVLIAGLCAYAAWFTSFGRFPSFTRVANPYVELGEAFLHGQVALLEQPDPRLTALENPYDYQQRETVPYRWDLSYYKGKYYAYWGPVPALLYAAVQLFTRVPPPDQMGILVFYGGLGALLTLTLFLARQWAYPNAPAASIPLFVLAALLNLPFAFLLARPQVYETSVLAGQFFLFGGIFAGLCYARSRRTAWLAAAGLSCGLAAASRYNLAITVGLFTAFAVTRLWRAARSRRDFWTQAAALIAPLALCAVALALYNFARFENPLETGLGYQLTVSVYQGQHFSPGYAPTNLYMYLFYPARFSGQFPFIPSVPIAYDLLPGWVGLNPNWPYDEVFFGALASVPLLWLAGLLSALGADWLLARSRTRSTAAAVQPEPDHASRAVSVFSGLAAAASLAQFAFLLFYYFGAMRFHADYLPLALFALALGCWSLDARLANKPFLRGMFWLVAAVLALVTSGMGFLAAFDIPPQFFRASNPNLWHAVAAQFNTLHQQIASLPESPGIVGALLRLLLRVFTG